MNIEIANRLVKLRKEKGMSQEELADALGISRQAVSKWERAEASPDTDNLICLAKLYSISLDDILSTDESIEDLKKEQEDKAAEQKAEENKKANAEYVRIDNSGVHIKDDDGSEVHIGKGGFKAFNEHGHRVYYRDGNIFKLGSWIEGVLMLVAVAGYLVLGFLTNTWGAAWILFLLPSIIGSIIKSIQSKDPTRFNISFLAVYIYMLVCMVHPGGLWHPMWVIFLSIPIYYAIVGPFRKHSYTIKHDCDGRKECTENCDYDNCKKDED